MKPVLIARFALAGAGIVVWGLGARTGSTQLTWTGIGLLILSLLLRFAKNRPDN